MKRTPLRRTGSLKRTGPIERKSVLARVKPMRKRRPFEPKNGPSDQTLDDLCRDVVFARDGYKCIRCGAVCTESWINSRGATSYAVIQWSHILSRTYKSIRWNPLNSAPKCGGCHIWWGENTAGEAHAWFKAKYPGRMELMDQTRKAYKQNGSPPLDRRLIEVELRQLLRRANQG